MGFEADLSKSSWYIWVPKWLEVYNISVLVFSPLSDAVSKVKEVFGNA